MAIASSVVSDIWSAISPVGSGICILRNWDQQSAKVITPRTLAVIPFSFAWVLVLTRPLFVVLALERGVLWLFAS